MVQGHPDPIIRLERQGWSIFLLPYYYKPSVCMHEHGRCSCHLLMHARKTHPEAVVGGWRRDEKSSVVNNCVAPPLSVTRYIKRGCVHLARKKLCVCAPSMIDGAAKPGRACALSLFDDRARARSVVPDFTLLLGIGFDDNMKISGYVLASCLGSQVKRVSHLQYVLFVRIIPLAILSFLLNCSCWDNNFSLK
jgi:hypothetical protein